MMTAVLRIPTVLRPAMGGATTIDVEGATIGDVLDRIGTDYPAVRGQLLNDDGTLHRFLNVYINDDDVRYLGGLDAKVADRDEITLLPAVAGGVA
jgi:molybdopterin converting factor small subunit